MLSFKVLMNNKSSFNKIFCHLSICSKWMYSFVSKIVQFKLEQILDNIKHIVPSYFPLIYTSWNKYFVVYMFSHLRNRLESSEGWIYHIRKENKPLDVTQTIDKDKPSRRLCLEGWPLKRCFSWTTSPSKLLLYDSRIIFKSQIWRDKL